MKKYLISTMIALAAIFSMNAQEINSTVKKGDFLEIVKPSGNEFKHINFPKKNIIIKRGGILNNAFVNGKKVVVSKVNKQNDGSTTISIKRVDGGRFYNAIHTVSVDFEEALKSGEIKISEN